MYVFRLHFHKYIEYKKSGFQFLLLLIYSTISLLAVTAYAIYFDPDSIVTSHISIEKFRELLGMTILISFLFGLPSSLTIIFIDRIMIRKMH